MKKLKNKWVKTLLIISIIISVLTAGGYLSVQYLKHEIKAKLTGCILENKNFQTVIDFEYVSNWIVVKVKIDGSDKEYPFLFDTGAQTVILDSLLKEIGTKSYNKITSGARKDTVKNAFNNEIITLNELQLGNVKFRDIGAVTAINSEWGMLNCVSAYGIIGYNILQTCGFQIDYRKKQIIITDQINNLSNFDKIYWIKYKSSINSETPIIPAVINDDLKIYLFFDTGNSGGIKLISSNLYKTISEKFPDQTAKLIFTPVIRIRGERDEPNKSMLFKATRFSLGNNLSKDINISIDDAPEREFSGFIGNKYFENYIITVDYKGKRVGFISNGNADSNDNSTFGLSYIPAENKIFVASVYEGSEPAKKGILVGDEIISINGIKIPDLPSETFCKIYRKEVELLNREDSIMFLEIIKNGDIIQYKFNKYQLF